jgi:hypothetical protein
MSGEDEGVMPQLHQGAGKFPRGIGGAATEGRKLVVNQEQVHAADLGLVQWLSSQAFQRKAR